MAGLDPPRFDAPITAVVISDADFYDPGLFNGLSPLHPEGLERILQPDLNQHPTGVILDVQIHPPVHENADRTRARLRLCRTLELQAV